MEAFYHRAWLLIQPRAMEKSIYSLEAEVLSSLLKRVRKEQQLTQVEVARRLRRTQSFVSKVEKGEIMIDAVVLFLLCRAMEVSFRDFADRFEKEWHQKVPQKDERLEKISSDRN
jgi:transcriptional regulator with XRE-family HTH domain